MTSSMAAVLMQIEHGCEYSETDDDLQERGTETDPVFHGEHVHGRLVANCA